MDSNEMLVRAYGACHAQQRPGLTATTMSMSKRYHQALLDPSFALDPPNGRSYMPPVPPAGDALLPATAYPSSGPGLRADYLTSTTTPYDLDMTDMAALYPARTHNDENYFYTPQTQPQFSTHPPPQQSIFSSSFDTMPSSTSSTASNSYLPVDDSWGMGPPTDVFADMHISPQQQQQYARMPVSRHSSTRPRRALQTPSPIPTIHSLTPSPIDPLAPKDKDKDRERDLSNYGLPNADGTWRCAYPGCTSATVFRRGCDLRKHYKRHRKHLFCRHEGCPQAVAGGFSSKKDRDRHETKHNPGVECEWPGCGRVFSRVDNMKDHVRRIHRR